MKTRPPDAVTYTLADGQLILTVPANAVWVCPDCTGIHVTLIDKATRRSLLTLAAGIGHLAERHATD